MRGGLGDEYGLERTVRPELAPEKRKRRQQIRVFVARADKDGAVAVFHVAI